MSYNTLYNEHLTPENYSQIDLLANCEIEHFRKIGLGPKSAESIYNWFREPNNIKIINNLKEAGVLMD